MNRELDVVNQPASLYLTDLETKVPTVEKDRKVAFVASAKKEEKLAVQESDTLMKKARKLNEWFPRRDSTEILVYLLKSNVPHLL